jgi:hypothetical protein
MHQQGAIWGSSVTQGPRRLNQLLVAAPEFQRTRQLTVSG